MRHAAGDGELSRAATSTAAIGSKWQPIEIAKPAMVRTTEAIDDPDGIGLLEERI